MINQGQTVQITADNLSATVNEEADDSVSFLINQYEHGHFAYSADVELPVTCFQQHNVSSGIVRFV